MVVWRVYFDHVADHRDNPLMRIPSEGNRYAHKPVFIDDKDWEDTVTAWKKLHPSQGGRRMSRRRKQRVRRSRRASSRSRRGGAIARK